MITKYTPYLLIVILIILSACDKEEEETIKIACVGDSITYGEGINNRNINSYPAQLENLLGSSYDVENFGVTGATMLRNGDLSFWDQPQLDSTMLYEPNIIFIMLGSNDSKPWNWNKKEQYKKDYLSMIDKFQTLPTNPKIYICNPPPAFKVQWGINDPIIRNDIIPTIASIAQIEKLEQIDFHSIFMGKGRYFPDYIHPDSAGASIIASTIANTVIHK